MERTVNKVIVIGYLGRDPEMKYTPAGQAVTSFSVASNHSYTASDGQRKQEVEWFNVSAFGKLAEVCNQYLAKGQQVYVEGRLKSRSYQTQAGETKHVNDIMAQAVEFLSRAEGREGAAPATVGAGQDMDALPF